MFANPFGKAVSVLDGLVTVHDESAIASPAMDKLVYTAVFGEPDDREDARWLIWETGGSGVSRPRSTILSRSRPSDWLVASRCPAMNIRGCVYRYRRACFRSAVRLKVGEFIQEIARSESRLQIQATGGYVEVICWGGAKRRDSRSDLTSGSPFPGQRKNCAVDPVDGTELGQADCARALIAAGRRTTIDVDTSKLGIFEATIKSTVKTLRAAVRGSRRTVREWSLRG